MIELRLLRYLLAVVDCGSVAGASRTVHVAQPSLSRQLRNLEHTLGFDVFDRTGNRLTLTAAGRRFVPEARELVARAAETEAAAHRLASGALTKLVISAPMTTITEMISPFLAKTLAPDDPHIDVWPVQPVDGYTPLDAGADIAVASATPHSAHAVQRLGKIPLFAQFRRGHPWTERSAVHVQELADQPLVLLTTKHRMRTLLDGALNAAGATYHSYVECQVPRTAQALAAAGRGVVVLTDLPEFDLVAVPLHHDGGPIEVPIHAAWDPKHFASQEIARFTRGLRDHYTERLATTSRFGMKPHTERTPN